MTRRKLFHAAIAAVAAPAIAPAAVQVAQIRLMDPTGTTRELRPVTVRLMLGSAMLLAGMVGPPDFPATPGELRWGALLLRDIDITWAGLGPDDVRWLPGWDIQGQIYALAASMTVVYAEFAGPKFKPVSVLGSSDQGAA